MIEAFGIESVYAAEEALMATLAEGELMARAVEGLSAVTLRRLQERSARRVVGLIGTGNNGADALYALAQLADLGFAAVAVTTDRVHEGAHDTATSAGVVFAAEADAAGSIAEADLVLDGILGIGGRPEVPDYARGWVEAIPDAAYVIAVDLPTGADPEGRSGDPAGVFADETVTFSVAKPVHLLPATEPRVGLLTVVDIGLSIKQPATVCRMERDDVAALWPVPGMGDDKYSRGVLGVVAGSADYPGAAVLVATAAAAAGAGMIRYIGPAEPRGLVHAAVPEVVPGPGRVQAWVIGPGLVSTDDAGVDRLDPEQRCVVEDALAGEEPVLLDAGGLDLIAGDLGRRKGRPTVLTPHAGECARLLGVERAAVEQDPVGHAEELARRSGAVVLLKGSTTVIVLPDPEEPVLTQRDAPAWLATAGAGDVLSGLIGTLLAAGLDEAVAAGLGALVHGVAADEANPGGPLRALSVADEIPRTVARLLRR